MFTEVRYATRPGSARPNEDLAVAGPSWAVVLDGATAAAGAGGGCAHGVAWLVGRLGGALAAGLAAGGRSSLADILAEAISVTMGAHSGTCDLGDPDSPSATVAMMRLGGGVVEYLVLGDSPVVLARAGGGAEVIGDDRVERLPGGRPYSPALVRRMRNAEGGFWVASTRPEAAGQAVSGVVEASGLLGAGLFTDGVTRLVEWYGWSWEAVLAELVGGGPGAVISAVRGLEVERGAVRGKPHDDATALWAAFPSPP
ncbi:protein phosphatase 2C domain-containing protein [Nonomuraea sp. NPDC005692]|uniref:protein phosphatase 2C domain-containing protein n=1 Tax=Nonomuraea sp. NPDC005692 TaxID=3157168 RepID=UPI0033E48DF9